MEQREWFVNVYCSPNGRYGFGEPRDNHTASYMNVVGAPGEFKYRLHIRLKPAKDT